MTEIINHLGLQWIRRKNLAYSEEDINEIRTDIAKFFMIAPCVLGALIIMSLSYG